MKIEDAIQQTKPFQSPIQKLIVNLLYTSGWVESQMIRSLKAFDLSPQQFNILRILRGKSPESMCLNDIGARMLDKNSNVSRIIEKMVQKELVERKVSATDRRYSELRITELGLKKLEEIDQREPRFDELLSSLSDEMIQTLNDGLDAIRMLEIK